METASRAARTYSKEVVQRARQAGSDPTGLKLSVRTVRIKLHELVSILVDCQHACEKEDMAFKQWKAVASNLSFADAFRQLFLEFVFISRRPRHF